MSAPKVSVIIPVYNHASELSKTLESIFSQTFQDLEVIVVNDGSTDDVASVLFGWQVNRQNLKIVNQANLGAPSARNRGFKESVGRYVIFWDADLTTKPEMLEKMIKVLDEKTEIDFVYSAFNFGWKKFACGSFDANRLKKDNYIHTSSLLRREKFTGFDETLKKFQDWDLWLTLVEKGSRGYWLNEYLFRVQPRYKGYSSWLPAFIYRFSWLPLPVLKKYNHWKKIVQNKHKI
jgi:glycosyltransferase involved in cell wall biosynthesis